MKLFEMVGTYKSVLGLVEKEELDEQDLLDTKEFITAELELEGKGEGLIYVNTEFETELAKLDALGKMIADKKKSLKNNQAKFKELVKGTLEELDIKTVKTSLGNITVRKGSQSLVITDDTKIPKEFEVIKVEIDKTQLKKAIKDGLECEGAELVIGDTSLSMPKPKF